MLNSAVSRGDALSAPRRLLLSGFRFDPLARFVRLLLSSGLNAQTLTHSRCPSPVLLFLSHMGTDEGRLLELVS